MEPVGNKVEPLGIEPRSVVGPDELLHAYPVSNLVVEPITSKVFNDQHPFLIWEPVHLPDQSDLVKVIRRY